MKDRARLKNGSKPLASYFVEIFDCDEGSRVVGGNFTSSVIESTSTPVGLEFGKLDKHFVCLRAVLIDTP